MLQPMRNNSRRPQEIIDDDKKFAEYRNVETDVKNWNDNGNQSWDYRTEDFRLGAIGVELHQRSITEVGPQSVEYVKK
jgi:hypothetical protein